MEHAESLCRCSLDPLKSLQQFEFVAKTSRFQYGDPIALSSHVVPVKDRPAYWLGAVAVIWLCLGAVGLAMLWQYDNAPGEAANAPGAWPSGSRLIRATDTPTLVMLAHPQCTCSYASLGELEELLARTDAHPRTYVVFLKPAAFGEGWEKTDLWRAATRLPNVSVVRDDDGVEARSFGAATSGQTMLYDRAGRLQFSGGITGSRAHRGDNAGRQSLLTLLNGGENARADTNVFGCPLFASGS